MKKDVSYSLTLKVAYASSVTNTNYVYILAAKLHFCSLIQLQVPERDYGQLTTTNGPQVQQPRLLGTAVTLMLHPTVSPCC